MMGSGKDESNGAQAAVAVTVVNSLPAPTPLSGSSWLCSKLLSSQLAIYCWSISVCVNSICINLAKINLCTSNHEKNTA